VQQAMIIDCAGKPLDLSSTCVMGVLNITTDSFSDGGQYVQVPHAVERAMQMIEEGAAIIDIGGESTRPGAEAVPVEEELGRVIPVIKALVGAKIPVPVSIDTSKPEVMQAAVNAGAGMINDVRALQEPDALAVAEKTGVPVCLMHMQGKPRTMQEHPQYNDVVDDIVSFLKQRIQACVDAGISREKLLVDPGFGFGKTLEQNLALLKHLDSFLSLQSPVLVGISRKSMIGSLLEATVEQRKVGSISAAVIAAWQGASVIRAHDVRETVEALKICDSVRAIH
jgi:dihydropteroate synthase